MDDAVDRRRSAAGRRHGRARFSTGQRVADDGPDGKPLVLYDNVFPATPSGKIELKSETLAERWGARPCCRAGASMPVSAYPLMLISPASDKRISSTLGDLAGSRRRRRC